MNRQRNYIPVFNKNNEELDHRKEPQKTFDHAIEMHDEDVINEVFLLAKDIYCLTEHLRTAIGDATTDEIKAAALCIASNLGDKTKENLWQAYHYPNGVHRDGDY